MKKSKRKADRNKGNPPVKVTVSIDDQGVVVIDPDCVVITHPKQRIRWKLDPASAPDWRLVGVCWCGDTEPPVGEFYDWLNEKDRISVTDRNTVQGQWNYGVLYRRKGAPKEAPRVFDPVIRNEPQ